MKRLAYQISVWNQKKLKLSEQERQVTEYGMEIFLDGIFKLLIILGTGAVLGRTVEFAVFLVAFCGLRCWAGGVHCRTAGRCTAAMVFICLTGLAGEWILVRIPAGMMISIWTGCILVLMAKAPGETGKDGYFSESERKKRKWKSVLCGMLLWGCFAAVPHMSWKGAIVMAAVVETLSILPCKGNKYNTADEKEKRDEETEQAGSGGKRDCGAFGQECGE